MVLIPEKKQKRIYLLIKWYVDIMKKQYIYEMKIIKTDVYRLVGVGSVIKEFDPQIFDACSLPVLCLQIHQPLAAVVAGIPQMVDIRIIAGFDDSSLSDREGRFIHNGLIQKLCQV
jgi:hypothetical protein